MSETSDKLKSMIATLEGALADAEKFDSGVSSPATRVRAALQAVINAARDARSQIQEARNARKASSGDDGGAE